MKISKKVWIELIIYAVIILIVMGIFLTCVPIKHKIDKTMNGSEISADNEVLNENIELHMKGYYYNYLIEAFEHYDYYRGTFEVSSMPETKDDYVWFNFWNISDEIKSASMEYTGAFVCRGRVTMTGRLEQMYIETEDGKYMLFPLEKQKEIVEMKKMLH